MRCGLPFLGALTAVALGVGAACGVGAAENPNAPAEATTSIKRWDGVGNDIGAGPHAGWRWRPAGDPTASDALNAAGATSGGLGDGSGVFTPEGQALDGAPTEIYTIGGKPLSPAAVAAGPEPTGPWAFLTKLSPKGLPAPATWALIVIGFALIVVAVRGLWTANRNLARLRSEDDD